VVNSLREHLVSRFGADFVPKPPDMNELREHIQAYQDLTITLTSLSLEQALEKQMLAAVSDYTRVVAGSPPKR
jgi:hypothetical protein